MNVRFVNVAIHENRVLVRGKEKASEVCLTFFWNSTSTSHYVDSYSLIIVCHLKLFSHCWYSLVGSFKPIVKIPDLLTDASCKWKMSSRRGKGEHRGGEGEPPMVQRRRLLSLTGLGARWAKPTGQKWPRWPTTQWPESGRPAGWPTQWPAVARTLTTSQELREQRPSLDLELCLFSASVGLNRLLERQQN